MTFNGRTPSPRTLHIGVAGDNLSQKITFKIDRNLSGELYLKLEGDGYINKIPLDYDNGIAEWAVARNDVIRSGRLFAQLQFERDKDVIWQSYKFGLEVAASIPADDLIEEYYPSVLRNLNRRVTAFEAYGLLLDSGEIASVTGPKGEIGEQGPQGPKGEIGAQGPRGEPGETAGYTREESDARFVLTSDRNARAFFVPVSSWRVDSGDTGYSYSAEINVPGVKENDLVRVDFSAESQKAAFTSRISSSGDIGNDKFVFYAKEIPATEINGFYTVHTVQAS